MKNKSFLLLLILLASIFLNSCSDEKSPEQSSGKDKPLELVLFDTTKLENAIELNENLRTTQFTNFKIVFLDKSSKKLYLELNDQPNKYFYTSCSIDSVIEFNLLGTEMPERVYLGRFKFISEIYGDFSFLAIDCFDQNTGKYRNLFNDYFILDNNSTLDLALCEKFINENTNALLVSYSEGTGNYLDFRIYGLEDNFFKQIYEPRTPLENGFIAIDSSNIYFLEGIISGKIYSQNENIQEEFLEETPKINYRTVDFVLNLKPEQNGYYDFPRFVILNSQSSLFVVLKGKINQEKNLFIKYDNEYFQQNFNSFIPKKDGMTTLEFINSDQVTVGKVRVIIKSAQPNPPNL